MENQIQLPPLAEGEVYVGAIGDQQGNLHHIIMLPVCGTEATWPEQIAWAGSLGADLPTRAEQALIWERCRDRLKKDWYWSNEAHHEAASFAWSQTFASGCQGSYCKITQLRAVAVRRLSVTIQGGTPVPTNNHQEHIAMRDLAAFSAVGAIWARFQETAREPNWRHGAAVEAYRLADEMLAAKEGS